MTRGYFKKNNSQFIKTGNILDKVFNGKFLFFTNKTDLELFGGGESVFDFLKTAMYDSNRLSVLFFYIVQKWIQHIHYLFW